MVWGLLGGGGERCGALGTIWVATFPKKKLGCRVAPRGIQRVDVREPHHCNSDTRPAVFKWNQREISGFVLPTGIAQCQPPIALLHNAAAFGKRHVFGMLPLVWHFCHQLTTGERSNCCVQCWWPTCRIHVKHGLVVERQLHRGPTETPTFHLRVVEPGSY